MYYRSAYDKCELSESKGMAFFPDGTAFAMSYADFARGRRDDDLLINIDLTSAFKQIYELAVQNALFQDQLSKLKQAPTPAPAPVMPSAMPVVPVKLAEPITIIIQQRSPDADIEGTADILVSMPEQQSNRVRVERDSLGQISRLVKE